MKTLFEIVLIGEQAVLLYKKHFVDMVQFPPKTDFYVQKTATCLPFVDDSVIQGIDWVAFQCLWPCEYAVAGKPCAFCFSGADFETIAKKEKVLPKALSADDVAEIVDYAISEAGCNSVHITGGSTFESIKEQAYITSYLDAINQRVGRERVTGDILLYITPLDEPQIVDGYIARGASKIACSLEVWNLDRAARITPEKIDFIIRKRHLNSLEYISAQYGPGIASSNLLSELSRLNH